SLDASEAGAPRSDRHPGAMGRATEAPIAAHAGIAAIAPDRSISDDGRVDQGQRRPGDDEVDAPAKGVAAVSAIAADTTRTAGAAGDEIPTDHAAGHGHGPETVVSFNVETAPPPPREADDVPAAAESSIAAGAPIAPGGGIIEDRAVGNAQAPRE